MERSVVRAKLLAAALLKLFHHPGWVYKSMAALTPLALVELKNNVEATYDSGVILCLRIHFFV